MAGSFYHLWIARQACSIPFSRDSSSEMIASYMAGAVAPDLGFFPGGPQRLSERIHRERCGDFLRALLAQSRSEEERAFAAGWALHLYTDLAVHPWVEAKVRSLERERGDLEGYADLWHMRSEWGIDCQLLERADLDYLWNVDLRFPRCRRDPSLLEMTGTAFYGEDARRERVERGMRSVEKWMRYLPRVLLLCGKVHPPGREGVPGLTPLLDRLTEKIFGEWLVEVKACKTEAVLAKPWRSSQRETREVEELGQVALRAFEQGWRDGFAQFEYLDPAAEAPRESPSTI